MKYIPVVSLSFLLFFSCVGQNNLAIKYSLTRGDVYRIMGGWSIQNDASYMIASTTAYSWGVGNVLRGGGALLIIDSHDNVLSIELPGLAVFPIDAIQKVGDNRYIINFRRAKNLNAEDGWKERGFLIIDFINDNEIVYDERDYPISTYVQQVVTLYKIAGPDMKTP